MWDILLAKPKDCVKVARRYLILRTEYVVRRRSKIAVVEIPPQFIGEYPPVSERTNTGYHLLYPDTVSRFGIMLDRKPYLFPHLS